MVAAQEARWRRWGRSLGREPLASFFALGALLFGVARWREKARAEAAAVVVSDDFVRALSAQRRTLTGRDPTPAEAEALAVAWAREEALYREGLRLGLDRDDVIVRRRVVQKVEFLAASTVDVGAPTEEALRAYANAHPEAYRVPARRSLRQRYFARDRRGARCAVDAEALTEAQLADDATGDPLLTGLTVRAATRDELALAYGEAFADVVFALPEGRWSRVVQSPLGAHRVWVTEVLAAREAPWVEVRGRVAEAWARERRADAERAAADRIAARWPLRRVREAP